MLEFLPGTDFIFSGYAAEPNYDNMFAGSNFDAEDFDDYNVFQRDMQVDGGLRPVKEADVIAVRNKAARAVQAVFRQLGLAEVTDEQVEAITYAHGSKDTLPRDVAADLMSAEDVMKRGITGVDVVRALAETGFTDLAENVLAMLEQRVIGDYMQTAAILDSNFKVMSGVNTPNDYLGPGTGYRLEGERWEEIKRIPHRINPMDI
jgi:glycerol dehydratase large subunit